MRITSFDVFDTLLTRVCADPPDIFRLVAREIGEPAFAAARPAAESAARRSAPAGEATLAEIYAEAQRQLGWNAAQRENALRCEIAIETRHLRAVETMRPVLAAARQRGDQVIFLSDMYLPARVIADWLRTFGYWVDGDRLYVSNEHRAGKGSGALFEIARTDLDASFSNWSHYGDHPWSDGRRPRQLGIDAPVVTGARLLPRERQALSAAPGATSPLPLSLLAGTIRCLRLRAPLADVHAQALHEVATGVAGPLLHGFVSWCIQEAQRRGIQRLYFLSRSGQVMARVAAAANRTYAASVDCRYLYSSRLGYVTAAAAENPAQLRELAAPTALHHSIAQTLTILGLDAATGRALIPADLGEDWHRNLPLAQRARLADLLLSTANLPQVQARLRHRAELARAYLATEGVDAGAPIAVVDTGWFGSTQRALEQLLGSPGAPAPLTGFYLGTVEQTPHPPAGEMLGYTNSFSRLSLRRDTSHLVLLELLTQADHGPLVGFTRDETGRVVPELDPAGPARPDEIRRFQDAVMSFVHEYMNAAPEAGAGDAAWARAAIRLYRSFHDHPSRPEVEVFGRMPHADQLKEGDFAQLAPELSLARVARALASPRHRPPCWWLAGQEVLGHRWMIRPYRLAKRLKWLAQTALTGLRD